MGRDEGLRSLLLAKLSGLRRRHAVLRTLNRLPAFAAGPSHGCLSIVLALLDMGSEGPPPFLLDVTDNDNITRLPRALAFLPHVTIKFKRHNIQYPPKQLSSGSEKPLHQWKEADHAAQTASARRFLLSAFRSGAPDRTR